VSEQEKKTQRLERFGTTPNTENGAKKILNEKLAQRAQRFGLPIKGQQPQQLSPLSQQRLQARTQRFGAPGTHLPKSINLTWSAEEEEKKRKRAEKYAQPEKKQKTT